MTDALRTIKAAVENGVLLVDSDARNKMLKYAVEEIGRIITSQETAISTPLLEAENNYRYWQMLFHDISLPSDKRKFADQQSRDWLLFINKLLPPDAKYIGKFGDGYSFSCPGCGKVFVMRRDKVQALLDEMDKEIQP